MRRTRIILTFLVAFSVMSLVVPEAAAHGVRQRGFSTRPVVKNRSTFPSELVAVRVGRHRTFERTIFEFRGSLPNFQSVRYVPAVKEDGSGNPVPLAGRAFIEVTLAAECGSPAPGPCPPAPGVPAGSRTLRQVANAGSSTVEGNASYGLGLRRRVGFRVFELSNPSRVVVDFRR